MVGGRKIGTRMDECKGEEGRGTGGCKMDGKVKENTDE